MKRFEPILITLCLSLILSQVRCQEYPFAIFNNHFPPSVTDIGNVNTGSVITATVSVLGTYGTVGLTAGLYKTDLTTTVISFPNVTATGNTKGSSTGFRYTVPAGQTGHYYVRIKAGAGAIVSYKIDVFVDGTLVATETNAVVYDSARGVNGNFVTISSTCKMRIRYNGPPAKVMIFNSSAQLARSTTGEFNFTFPTAQEYYIAVEPTTAVTNIPFTPYTITLTTFCDSYCASASNPSYRPVCSFCGDGILDEGEQCDNGNQPGCTNCLTSLGYNCWANLGGTSICNKSPFCGDAIVDAGQQCDNGNRLGCLENCVPDSGYSCTKEALNPSVCSFCGNGLVQGAEECDNNNQIGCTNCKIDPGFQCLGTGSWCIRSNPVCGNRVIEVGEACDDGNTANSDGCSNFCTVEPEYTCNGTIGQISGCVKTVSLSAPVCGNNIYEPGVPNVTPDSISSSSLFWQYWTQTLTEQCDNGNQAGCINCQIQSGWKCAGAAGSPSDCYVDVVVPHCGNGIYESSLGEACDDGNIANGDGCSALCNVEYPWYCFDHTRCFNPLISANLPLFVATFCGNGAVESLYGQQCDDGNKVAGDGCSETCKQESGWNCYIYSNTQSSCSRAVSGFAFCGNGLVDSGQQCDDGFPLRNGDGCSITCQIESGWSCGITMDNSQVVSKCWQLWL